METTVLLGRKREKSTKSVLLQMRKAGKVPGVIYGLEKEPELLEVNFTDLRPHLPKLNHVIELDVDGKKQTVLIKAIEREAIKRTITHIDFLRVNEERFVTVAVPVTTHGMPVGVKTQGGVFSQMKKFVRLKTKIQDIPDSFDLDVSELASGTIFYVRDLQFEKGSFVTPPKTALFGVTSGRKEEEVAAPGAATPAAAAKPAAAKAAAKAPAAAAKAPAAAKPAAKKK